MKCVVRKIVLPSSQRVRIVDQAWRRACGIKAGRRLVEEDQVGIPNQCERQVEPAPLPARERRGARVAFGVQFDQSDQLVGAATTAVVATVHLEQLADREVVLHAAGLQHDADALAQLTCAAGRVQAEHADLAGAALAIALEDLGGRRLSGAVRAEQAEHLADRDAEADVANGFKVAVALGEPPDFDRIHRRL